MKTHGTHVLPVVDLEICLDLMKMASLDIQMKKWINLFGESSEMSTKTDGHTIRCARSLVKNFEHIILLALIWRTHGKITIFQFQKFFILSFRFSSYIGCYPFYSVMICTLNFIFTFCLDFLSLLGVRFKRSSFIKLLFKYHQITHIWLALPAIL